MITIMARKVIADRATPSPDPDPPHSSWSIRSIFIAPFRINFPIFRTINYSIKFAFCQPYIHKKMAGQGASRRVGSEFFLQSFRLAIVNWNATVTGMRVRGFEGGVSNCRIFFLDGQSEIFFAVSVATFLWSTYRLEEISLRK